MRNEAQRVAAMRRYGLLKPSALAELVAELPAAQRARLVEHACALLAPAPLAISTRHRDHPMRR